VYGICVQDRDFLQQAAGQFEVETGARKQADAIFSVQMLKKLSFF